MKIEFSTDDIKPIVRAVLTEYLSELGNDDRLAYTEEEAAEKIGVARHVLRDERLKGNIEHGKAGRKVVYSRRQLLEFVERTK